MPETHSCASARNTRGSYKQKGSPLIQPHRTPLKTMRAKDFSTSAEFSIMPEISESI
jgi:hypothetical protein